MKLLLSFLLLTTTLPWKIVDIEGLNYPTQQQSPTYSELKNEILSIKSKIQNQQITNDSLSTLFTHLLTNKIIPHWLSTPWSFEGHTSVPGQGEIACGYFVSTTLQDMGFNINRYKLAQQSPIHEAKTLNLGKPVLEINSNSVSERIEKLKAELKEGIYFIGFDQSHVGYIQKKGDRLFLIHSNYINAEGVVIEMAEVSIVFASYSKLYIAEISTNKELLKKWLDNDPIIIVSR